MSSAFHVLFLHGAQQDEEVFRYKSERVKTHLEGLPLPSSVTTFSSIKCFYLSAPHLLSLRKDDDDVPMRVWFTEAEDRTIGGGNSSAADADPKPPTSKTTSWDKSLANILTFIKSSMDDHCDAILGFSQGCIAALRLVYDSPLVRQSTKGLVFCGAPDVADFLPNGSGSESSPKGQICNSISRIPSLHVIGSKDEIVSPKESSELCEKFIGGQLLRHNGAHMVPHGQKEVQTISDFIVSVIPQRLTEELQGQLQEELDFLTNMYESSSIQRTEDKATGATTVSVDLKPELTGGITAAFKIFPNYPNTPPQLLEVFGPSLKLLSEKQSQLYLRWRAKLMCSVLELGEELKGSGSLVFQMVGVVKLALDDLEETISHQWDGSRYVGSGSSGKCPAEGAPELNPWLECDDLSMEGYAHRKQLIQEAQTLVTDKISAIPDIHTKAAFANGGSGEWDFVIGLVGKPSAGKSTFFNAITDPKSELEAAKVGAFPFTTIEPNVGKAFVGMPCPCQHPALREKVGLLPTPPAGGEDDVRRCGADYGHFPSSRLRRIPISVKDVAGLVPGAYQGHGKGNRFLNDLCDADVLIHVLDGSGLSTAEGVEVGEDQGSSTPEEDARWIRDEIHSWIFDNVRAKWDTAKRKPARFLGLFSGYHARPALIELALSVLGISLTKLEHVLPIWLPSDLHNFIAAFVALRFPTVLALNKSDSPKSGAHAVTMRKAFPKESIVRMCARAECELLVLRKEGLVEYAAGGIPQLTKKGTEVVNKTGAAESLPSPRQQVAQKICEFCARARGTGVLGAVQAALTLRPPHLLFPVRDFTSFSAPGMKLIGNSSSAAGGVDAAFPGPSAAPAEQKRTSSSNNCLVHSFQQCLLIRPGSDVEDVYRLLHERYHLPGKFVRCEGIPLRFPPQLWTNHGIAAKQAEASDGTTHAHQHLLWSDVSADLSPCEAIILRREDVIPFALICRIMTNKKAD